MFIIAAPELTEAGADVFDGDSEAVVETPPVDAALAPEPVEEAELAALPPVVLVGAADPAVEEVHVTSSGTTTGGSAVPQIDWAYEMASLIEAASHLDRRQQPMLFRKSLLLQMQ